MFFDWERRHPCLLRRLQSGVKISTQNQVEFAAEACERSASSTQDACAPSQKVSFFIVRFIFQ